PPSVVRTIAGQRAPWHATLPRTQPSAEEMNVAETGSKPAGTALPCGFGDFGVAVATAADEAVGAGDAALAGAVVWLPGGVAVAPTLGPVAPGDEGVDRREYRSRPPDVAGRRLPAPDHLPQQRRTVRPLPGPGDAVRAGLVRRDRADRRVPRANRGKPRDVGGARPPVGWRDRQRGRPAPL